MEQKIVKNTVADYMDRYEAPVKALKSYLPWLESHAETDVAQTYQDSSTVMSFPVYDSTLLAFVKQAQNTGILNRNYVYAYSRHNLKTAEDELQFIERAQLADMDDLWCIVSRYVLEGYTRGAAWTEGVKSRVLYSVVKKMDDLLILWSKEATAIR